jgi:hypothetical protein
MIPPREIHSNSEDRELGSALVGDFSIEFMAPLLDGVFLPGRLSEFDWRTRIQWRGPLIHLSTSGTAR